MKKVKIKKILKSLTDLGQQKAYLTGHPPKVSIKPDEEKKS